MLTYEQLEQLCITDTKERAIAAMVAYGWSSAEARYAYDMWTNKLSREAMETEN